MATLPEVTGRKWQSPLTKDSMSVPIPARSTFQWALAPLGRLWVPLPPQDLIWKH